MMSAYFANVLPNNLLTASDLFGSTQSGSANVVTNVNNSSSSSASTLSSGSSSSSSNSSSASNSSSSLSVNSLNQQSWLIGDQRGIQHQATHQQLNVMNQISCNTGEMLVHSGNHLLNMQEINIFEENSSRYSSNGFNAYDRLPNLNGMKTHSNYSALSGFNNTNSSLQLQQQSQQHLVHSQSQQQQLVASQQLMAGASNASLALASGNSSHYNTSVSSSSSPDYMNSYKQLSANQLDSSNLQMANYGTHIIQGQPTPHHSQHPHQGSISNSHLPSSQSIQHLNPASQQQQQNAAAFAATSTTMQHQQQQSNLNQMAPPGQNYIYPWMRQAANVKTSKYLNQIDLA